MELDVLMFKTSIFLILLYNNMSAVRMRIAEYF